MNNRNFTLILLSALIALFVLLSPDLAAQRPGDDFRTKEYTEAIAGIVVMSEGKISENDVIHELMNSQNPESPPAPDLTIIPEIFFLSPSVRLVPFDGSEPARYSYYIWYPPAPVPDSALYIDFSGVPDWVDTLSTIINNADSSITINVLPNTFPVARSAAFTAYVNLYGSIYSYTAYILQEPAPPQYIFVSPNYLSVSPDGGITDPFTVLHFNLENGWEAVLTDDWIEVDSSTLTGNSIAFHIEANTTNDLRTAIIEIRAVNNPEVHDIINLYQYAGAQEYLIVSPKNNYIDLDGGIVEVFIYTNLSSWSAEILENPDGMIADLIQNPTGDTLTMVINPNQAANSRVGKVVVSGGSTRLSETIQIYQSAAYLLLNPGEIVAPCSGGVFEVDIISYGIDETGVTAAPDWVNANIINNESLQISVSENLTSSVRSGTVFISSLSNPAIYDSLQILQYSCNQAYILVSPAQQVANWDDTALANPFTITSNNTGDLGVTANAGWLEATIVGDLVFVALEVNLTGNTRTAVITVFDISDPSISGSVSVIQGGSLSFIAITPGFQSISHIGGPTAPFTVFTLNVENWEVFFDVMPPWITSVQISGNTVIMNLAANETPVARQSTFRVRDISNPGLFDEAVIFQEAATGSYLLLSPRQQLVSHTGNPAVNFQVTAVNVPLWAVDITSIPFWISVNASGQNILSLNVAENLLPETRIALIKIYDTGNPAVTDSVYIYQYSSTTSYLLASPQQQLISHFGNTNVVFEVTAVNISGWQFDPSTVPSSWITVTNSGGAFLGLSVAPNLTSQTRQATIRIFATGQPGIETFVSVYQYARPNAYLIASPRSKAIGHAGDDAVDFTVTKVNVNGWEFTNTAPYEDWIIFQNIGDSIIRLSVAENSLPQSRLATIVIQATNNTAIKDTVSVYQYSGLDSYLLASPRQQALDHHEAAIEFHIQAVNVDNWVVDISLLPTWITLGNSVADTLRLNVSMNTSQATRMATVYIFDESNSLVMDSVAVYQFASLYGYILAAPREKKVPHFGQSAVDFQITLVNVEGWEFADTTIYQDWIDFYNIDNSILRLSIDTNFSFQSRIANIVIQSVDDPMVKDSVRVYQYSTLDRYIIVDPREQFASRYSVDTLTFNVLAVNVSSPDFEVIYATDPAMIDIENSSLTGTQLTIIVNQNNDPHPREARIRVFDPENQEVSDTVSIYQDFPYIILRPAAISNISWSGTSIKINSYSNISEYVVSKGNAFGWYEISKDSVVWTNDPIILSGNDSVYLRVQTNSNAYLKRSSFLKFEVGSEVVKQLWFDQNPRPGGFFNLSGRVLIEGDEFQPLAGVSVALHNAIRITNVAGVYTYDQIPENWVGTITPLIDNTLPFPYYFYPPTITITGEGITSDTILPHFTAYSILPSVVISTKTSVICFGQTLEPGDSGYPGISLNNTYGPSTYSWTSEPPDALLAQNPNVLYPVFGPLETTTYTLEVTNFFFTTSDTFTIVVNNLPNSVDFEGPLTVCSNQGGVVYQVIDPPPGLYYSWKLDTENPGGAFTNSYSPNVVPGNIAIVNWENNPGNYTLTLFTHNELGCVTNPVTRNIVVTPSLASPATTVHRKSNDNMLYATDTLAKSYQWGWFVKNSSGELQEEYFIPGKNEWYCRLPDGHMFDPLRYHYFVITYSDESACATRSFFNAPVGTEEISQETFSVFPNPGNGVFTVRFDNFGLVQNGAIEVYNTMGQMVHFRNLVAGTNEQIIDLHESVHFRPGIFMIILRTSEFVSSTKIIVQ